MIFFLYYMRCVLKNYRDWNRIYQEVNVILILILPFNTFKWVFYDFSKKLFERFIIRGKWSKVTNATNPADPCQMAVEEWVFYLFLIIINKEIE